MCDNRLEIGKKTQGFDFENCRPEENPGAVEASLEPGSPEGQVGGRGCAGGCGPSALRLLLGPLCWVMTYRQARGWWPVPGSRVLDLDPRASSLAFIPHPQTSERGAPFCSLIAPKSLMHHSGL